MSTNELKRLPDSELEVMQIIWNQEPPVGRIIIEREMKRVHPIAQTTLLTYLTRLSEKGYLSIQKQGRSSSYTPLISLEEYQAKESKHFLDRLFGGNMNTFASALCESGLSKEDLKELRDLLDQNAL